MSGFSVRVRGNAVRDLENFGKAFGGAALNASMLAGAKKAGVVAERFVSKYPKKRRPANARKPYRRTGTLGKSITSTAAAANGRAAVRVGTAIKYGPYVLDDPWPKGKQARVHTGVWQPMRESIRLNLRPISEAFADGVQAEILRRLKQTRF